MVVSLRISVAIATHNGSAFLLQQLLSILQQTRPVHEVVVCDDASTDSTLDLLENFKSQNPSLDVIILRNTEVAGAGASFRRALRHSSGDAVFLCDQDDVWDRKKVERVLLAFDNPSIEVVIHDAEIVDQNLNSGSEFLRPLEQQVAVWR